MREYPLFEDCQRRNILYDVGEIMTRNIINEVPDDVKSEMLVETNYLPRDFEFPYNNEAKKRKFSSSHL